MSSLGPQVANQALRLEDLVRHLLAPWIGREIRVLEAGCGASSPIDFGKRAYVIGLDIDEQAMRTNEKLDQRLVGDLESYPMAADAFDLVFCRWVLEHLRNPELALHNMRLGLKPGGWMVLIFPNRWSLKGLVTRFTPHTLHRLGYHVLFGTGSPCEAQFASSVSPSGIRSFADQADLRVLMLQYHPGNFGWLLRKHSGLLGRLWLAAERVAQVLTLGRVSPERREVIAVLADQRASPCGPMEVGVRETAHAPAREWRHHRDRA